jgi:two-component system, LuxR family, sensor kinase FixL
MAASSAGNPSTHGAGIWACPCRNIGTIIKNWCGLPWSLNVTHEPPTLPRTGRYSDFRAAIVDEALDGIIVTDGTGTVLSFNRAAATLFGYSADEVIGRNVRMLMPEPYRDDHDTCLSNYLETGEMKIIGFRRQVEGQRKDGSIFPIELGVASVDQEGRRLFVGFTHDLSERRKFEARMQQLHAAGHDLVEHMAVGLAHELKQPLTAIDAYLSVVRRVLKEPNFSKERVEEVLDKAANQVFRLSEIMDNLRQFMARGVTEKTPQNLNDVVRTACEFTDALARESGVTTTVHLDAENDWVVINRVQIQQVVVNLKRNAVEAMQGCKRREMAVSTRLVDGDKIRVDVADTGPGLAETVRSKLFEPFTTTKPHGLGVGLSISHSIIEAHQGKLWAEDNPGGGAVFSFVLPLANQDRDEAATETAQLPAHR